MNQIADRPITMNPFRHMTVRCGLPAVLLWGLWAALPADVCCARQQDFLWPTQGPEIQSAPGPGMAQAQPGDFYPIHSADCATASGLPDKMMLGVDRNSQRGLSREPRWNDQELVPWENMAYGEYIGPYRTPHVPEYRLRVGDQLDFVYLLSRRSNGMPYQIFPGDTLSITALGDPSLKEPAIVVLSDGTVSLPMIGRVTASGKSLDQLTEELNQRFREEGKVRNPQIVVQVVKGDTPLNDLRDAVDARQGQGGQSRQVTVSPDGTIQLPLAGCIPAIGLSLGEIEREVNARYSMLLGGRRISVTPVLVQRASRSIYVLGMVNKPGRYEINGPTTAMQAIALAEGWQVGSNLRQIIVFRRDQNWQLVATKIDLKGALNGRRPYPADEIWLRDSDIVLIPRSPIQRFNDAVRLFTGTLYTIFPQQGIVFNFDGFTTF